MKNYNWSVQEKLLHYTRVTEVLSPFSGLNVISKEILENASARGTVVHKLCDYIALGVGVFEDDINSLIKRYSRNAEHFDKEKILVKNMVDCFERWAQGKKFQTKPERFFCDDLMLTGELDLIYINENQQLTLLDIKTPASESKTWLLQASAYSYLAKLCGYNLQNLEFLQLSRKENKEATTYTYVENFSLFKSHLDAYRYSFKDQKLELNIDYI